MRVIANYDPSRDRVSVYVETMPGQALIHEDGFDRAVDVPAGAVRPVYVDIPASIASELSAALEGAGVPEPATRAHLKDAIQTRDRLLGMVELAFAAQLGQQESP